MKPVDVTDNLHRISELLTEYGITDTDILKHRLEDHERWKSDVVKMDVELTELRSKVREMEKGAAFCTYCNWSTTYDAESRDDNAAALVRLRQHVMNCAAGPWPRIKELGEELKIANQIGESFWQGLKALKLTAINVQDPGSHVRQLAERFEYVAAQNVELSNQLLQANSRAAEVTNDLKEAYDKIIVLEAQVTALKEFADPDGAFRQQVTEMIAKYQAEHQGK